MFGWRTAKGRTLAGILATILAPSFLAVLLLMQDWIRGNPLNLTIVAINWSVLLMIVIWGITGILTPLVTTLRREAQSELIEILDFRG